MKKWIVNFSILIGIVMGSCKEPATTKGLDIKETSTSQANTDSTIVYATDTLLIQKLADHVYLHKSYLKTKDFGRVDCNGMIVVNGKEAIVFDTPADDTSATVLINYITNILQCEIKAIIPTHFHEDCVGGLEMFLSKKIPAYASYKTITLLKGKNRNFSKPLIGFNDSLSLDIGDKKVWAAYFGEGHTKDNIIGYFPDEHAIFGGCLIKESGAGNGNLEDANVKDWSATVRKIKQKYPGAKIVVPGHGKTGGTELLDYTISLFEQ